MFGISSFEIILFLRQAGLALAGASCLWGLYFFFKSRGSKTEKSKVFSRTAQKMFKPFTVGISLTAISWLWYEIINPTVLLAHEGISIVPESEQVEMALQYTTPLFITFLVVYLLGLIFRELNKQEFAKRINYFYLIELLLSFAIISIPAWTGGFGQEQIFFAGHGFHSIFTLGTVLVLDFIFVLTKYSEVFEKHLYPTLPTISKVIWVGLAIDFASVALIFDQAVAHTPKFLFMQTVIAIVIINGVFLSGPVVEKLLEVIRREEIDQPTPKWDKAMTISGSISAASWITVTFTDLIHEISLSYPILLGIYVVFTVVVYISYEILSHYKIGARW